MVRFNTDPLMAPLTPQELKALRQRRSLGEFGSRGGSSWILLVVLAFFFMLSIGPFATFITVARSVFRTNAAELLSPFVITFVGTFSLILAVVITIVVRSYRHRKNWALLARFADVNGMRFGIRSAEPRYPGVLFGTGRSRASTFHMFSPTGVLADVGGYEYTTGSGKNSTTHHWYFVAFRLPHPVPHLLLDAKANNSLWGTNLPQAFASSQRISLGEPFDSYYQLYAPEGYGRDAFQLLPPNVMEALLAAPVVYDIEMVDDWLFCYTQSHQNLADPATWRLLEIIANGVLGSLTPVVDRYSDSHLPEQAAAPALYGPGTPTPVAPLGRRLRSGPNLRLALLIVGVIGVAAFFLFIQMTYILAR